jgi:type I restriction enzyme S subunit
MIDDLKPYPEYKDSGPPWLGSLPSRWAIMRAKTLFREIDERSRTGQEELLSVSHITGVTPRSQKNVTMFLAKSNIGHKLCRPDDLVINTMWAWMAALGVTRNPGIVSPAYGVYRPLPSSHLLPRFADLLLRTPLYAAEYTRRSTGVNSSRLRLYPEQFLCIPVILPPSDEQIAIVRFLDYANRRVERAIRAKRKLIALLTEQKQAIIHHAVTRGLDPAVKLKPSGVLGLGDMPAHWDAKRLKAIAQIRYGLGQPPRESETGIPLIRATNIDHGRILEKNLLRVDAADVPKTRNAFLKSGEIIVVRSGALTADSAIIPQEYEGAVAGYDMVVTVNCECQEFVAMAMLSSYFQVDQLVISSMRAAQPHLNAEELGVAVLLLPPKEEQMAIVRFVQNECSPLDNAIALTEREIAFHREYRTTLTAEVVTGKLDIRNTAKQLPDEVEEPIPIGEMGECEELGDEPAEGADDDSE